MKGASEIDVLAPAKINLALHVTGLRGDGYHLIESLAVFTVFGDRLSVKRADEDCLTVNGRHGAATPSCPDNIVMRALRLYREATGHQFPKVSILLEKRLPVASGIGGGSSDAAAVLKALDLLADDPAGPGGLQAIGCKLGADLPMCLAARPLIATGIGENIRPLKNFAKLAMVLVNPAIEIPTPSVFKALESKHNPPLPPLPAANETGQIIEWLQSTRNDLEAPAAKLFPEILAVRRLLEEAGAEFIRMSGSGATFFGIFSDMAKAREAAAYIGTQKPCWFAVATETGEGNSYEQNQ